MKKLLITGSSGVLGTGFKLIQNENPNYEFVFSTSKQCNLLDLDSLVDHVKSVKPDAILHLAAKSGGIGLNAKYPATLLRDNVLMNMNVMEAARICSIPKTIMTLSTGMYPGDVPNPIKEEYMHNGEPHPSVYSYAYAKRLVEPTIRAYRTEFGMNAIGLIPNGILGENSNFSYEGATMVPALIRRFYENRNNTENIVIWGDGTPLREYTYAKDLARAYLWCLDNYNGVQTLHVGTIEEVSVRDIAYMLAEIYEIDKSRVVFDTTKPAGQHRKNTDNSKFVQLSNFKYTPFKEALNNTVRWFCEHYDEAIASRGQGSA